MKIAVCDRVSYNFSSRREYTDEGFLRVPGNVARTGIQDYLASELGLDGNPSRLIRVYRPAEEVFAADSLATYNAADMTNNHPKGLVTAATYKSLAVGVVASAGRQDGDFVQCDLIIKDAGAIDAINSGKCELSAGYTAIYDESPGVTPEGEPYDYVQREIRINHVAIVDRARAGALARVFDNKPTGGNNMPVFITNDSGRSIDVADPANAQVVADAFDRLQTKLTDAEADVQKAQASADAANDKLTDALKLTSDEAIAGRLAALNKVQATARRIVGDSFKCDSVDLTENMRVAMSMKRPGVQWADKSDIYVQTAFEMADEDMAKEEEEEGKEKASKDSAVVKQMQQLSADAAADQAQAQDAAPVISRAQAALLQRTGKAGK
jgi:uncharacterized protein